MAIQAFSALIQLLRRGFCQACDTRRMAETAAHLVEQAIPHVPVRQWVVAFPIPLRHLFATQPQLLSPVLQVIHHGLSTFVIHQAGLTQAQTGAVTLIQRFGSAAKLNIHLHCLMLDGVYRLTYEVVELGRVEHWCSPGAAPERFGARVYHGPQQSAIPSAPSSNRA